MARTVWSQGFTSASWQGSDPVWGWALGHRHDRKIEDAKINRPTLGRSGKTHRTAIVSLSPSFQLLDEKRASSLHR
jgi:hypothetical protein